MKTAKLKASHTKTRPSGDFHIKAHATFSAFHCVVTSSATSLSSFLFYSNLLLFSTMTEITTVPDTVTPTLPRVDQTTAAMRPGKHTDTHKHT